METNDIKRDHYENADLGSFKEEIESYCNGEFVPLYEDNPTAGRIYAMDYCVITSDAILYKRESGALGSKLVIVQRIHRANMEYQSYFSHLENERKEI